MNTPSALPAISMTSPRPRSRRRFRWGYALATLAGLFMLLVLTVAMSLRPGSESRAVRQAVISLAPDDWDRQFEIGIGRLPVLLAKTALVFAPLQPEVRAGLRAFKSGDVAVYCRRNGIGTPSGADLLTRVDELLARRGWERIVGIRDGTDSVGIFIPRDLESLERARICLFVLDGNDLVIVSARLNLEPLVDLASHHTHLFASR